MFHKITSSFLLFFFCFVTVFSFPLYYAIGIDILPVDNILPILDINSGAIQTGTIIPPDIINTLPVPDFKIVFQNPSYLLEKDLVKNIYECDKGQTDCKINLKLITLDDKDISTKFSCNIMTGFSGTISDCNPNTIIFPIGENNIIFKVFEKGNENNFKEKSIIFNNSGSTSTGSLTNSGSTQTGTVETMSGNTDSSGVISSTGSILPVPDFKIVFQNPSYLLEKDLVKNSYECDKNQIDCRTNLKLITLEDKDISTKFSCNIMTGFSGTISDCNPNTIIFPIGENNIIFKVFEKGNEINFKEKSIIFNNSRSYNSLIIPTSGGQSSSNTTTTTDSKVAKNTSQEEKSIVIQSGLDLVNGKYTCNLENCKINIKYENTNKQNCEWNFSSGEYKEKYLATCNPGTIYFKSGIYQISLKVKENGNLISEKNLFFENIYKKDTKEELSNPLAKITLQTKLSKNKILEGNKLICLNKEKCIVNFSGEDSYDQNKKTLKYYWDFGNGETGNIKNPKSITYETGNYKVKLKIENEYGKISEDIFLVEVNSEEEKLIDEIDINVSKSLKIYRILGNPKGVDDYEWIELKNTGIETINLKGVIIDDEINKGSKAFQIEEDIYLKPGKVKRFYKYTTNLSLANSFDEVNISYNSELIDSFRWNFDLPAGYIIEKDKLNSNFSEIFIERVVDGDTILIKFKDGKIVKLRLIGVDTPETKHPKKEVGAFGIEAYNFTKDNLEGKFVILEQDSENVIDKYGRSLGYIYLKSENSEEENIFFNKLLIQKGLARAYLYFPFKYSDEFKKIENIAKKDKIGLWGDKEVRKEFLELEKEEEKYLEEKEMFEEKKLFDKLFENSLEDNLKELKIFLTKFNKQLASNSQKSFIDLVSWNFNKNSNSKKLAKTIIKSKKVAKIKVKKIKLTQSISKQKKALKISGTTLPYSKIVITLGTQTFELKSDIKGKYSIKLTKLIAGNFEIQTKVYNELLAIIGEKIKEVSITNEYVENVKKANIKKSKKKAKIKKPKKLVNKDIKVKILPSNTAISKETNNINFLLLDIFIGFLSISLLFLIFQKLGYFGINSKLSNLKENYRNAVNGILGE